MNKLFIVNKEHLFLAWKDAAPYISKALKYNPAYKAPDILKLLKLGALQLWMFYNEESKKPYGAMVTEIIEHPQKRILSIFLLSADNFEDVESQFPVLLDYAKHMGAESIECLGRFGLEKLLAKLGFNKYYIVMNYDVK